MPTDPARRAETLQWLMWQMGGLGPMLGQFGFFHAYAGKEIDDKRPRDRYLNEGKRLLAVLDQRLDGQRYIMGDDYTIADIAAWPWIRATMTGYDAAEEIELSKFSNVMEWFDRCWSRPASQAAVTIPARP
ncbi:Glutathione S-transferase, C-terminal domain [Aliiroseovarius crassostreae]|nr:Glutathione S-transferase, C-terminal domain [Aliiroseovarius crassostreae]